MNDRYRKTGASRASVSNSARMLGWFSVGLGIAEVLLAGSVARAAGLRGQERLVRACGLREVATGVAILTASDPAPFVFARVAGDVMDAAVLGRQVLRGNPQSTSAATALVAVLGVSAADVACAQALSRGTQASQSLRDYGERSGFPRPVQQMRGAARADFHAPADMRVPVALRPYGTQ